MLYDNYQDVGKVKELISIGNISSLKEKIKPDNNQLHSFDSPQKDVTVAYHRDRNENWQKTKPLISGSIDDFHNLFMYSWLEYVYLYDEKNNQWLFSDDVNDEISLKLQPLNDYFRKKVEIEKPEAKIIGADGNVFNLISICRHSLEKAGMHEEAKEMTDRITSSGSYEEALSIMCEYIKPVSQNNQRFEDLNDYDDIDINI